MKRCLPIFRRRLSLTGRRRRKRSIRNRYCISLFIVLIGIACSAAFGQTGQPGEGEGQQQPEAPREQMTIVVKGDRLSVELINAEFGKVLRAIAKQKGFRVEISGDVAAKKLSTRFVDVELERGVMRLLTLMKEKNFTIQYDTTGAVSFIDVFGGTAPAAAGKAPQSTPPARPQIQRAITAAPATPVQQIAAPPVSAAAQPSRRPPVPVTTFRRPAAPTQPQPEQPKEDAGTVYHDNSPEEDVPEVPYIPSQSAPVYIPPRTK